MPVFAMSLSSAKKPLYSLFMRYLSNRSALKSNNQTIDLIPLIDVVFILLIFFSVSTTLKSNHGLELNLPDASPNPQKTAQLTIHVDANNRLSINQVVLNPDQFQRQLSTVIQAQPSIPIVIRADNSLTYQSVITVLDRVHKAGGKHAVLATTRRYDTP
jgi:biopolymer transport protein ExbD